MVRFRAADRVRLIGVMVGRGPRGVVLAHQGGGAPPNLCSWMPYARQLARAGFRVLAFDHRNSGSSARVGSPTRAWRVDLDVRGAVAELRRRGATSVVLGGASLGGTAVLAAAASHRAGGQRCRQLLGALAVRERRRPRGRAGLVRALALRVRRGRRGLRGRCASLLRRLTRARQAHWRSCPAAATARPSCATPGCERSSPSGSERTRTS